MTSFVPTPADNLALMGPNLSDHRIYTQIHYEHFQRAFGSGKNFGVARAVPGVKAELVECGTNNVLAHAFGDADGVIDFGGADRAAADNLQGLGNLCVRMHGESRLDENRSATRTMVTYGPAILGFENDCGDTGTIPHCRAHERFTAVYEPRARHIA